MSAAVGPLGTAAGAGGGLSGGTLRPGHDGHAGGGTVSCLALGSRRRLAQDQPVVRCPSRRCRSKAHSSWRAWNARGEWSLLWGGAGSPRFQGKVERSHRTDTQAFYQLLTYTGDVDLNEKLVEWENFYNDQRPHGALQGKTPSEALHEKLG